MKVLFIVDSRKKNVSEDCAKLISVCINKLPESLPESENTIRLGLNIWQIDLELDLPMLLSAIPAVEIEGLTYTLLFLKSDTPYTIYSSSVDLKTKLKDAE
jgi:hypothetical protein